MSDGDDRSRLVSVTLDEASIGRAPRSAEHERTVAVFDLVEENRFDVPDRPGPYRLVLSLADNRLVFTVQSEAGECLLVHPLPLAPLRRVVKDYFLVCDSYQEAIRTGSPSRIEAIDMGRRGLHDEGSEILRDRLAENIRIDHQTARRLFTLICALHRRN